MFLILEKRKKQKINNFYFTEYGVVYNTSILNIINEDPDLHNFRRNKQISSDDFRQKLNIYYQEILKPNYNLNVLNDIQILLKRSIDTDRFMFIYPRDSQLQMPQRYGLPGAEAVLSPVTEVRFPKRN